MIDRLRVNGYTDVETNRPQRLQDDAARQVFHIQNVAECYHRTDLKAAQGGWETLEVWTPNLTPVAPHYSRMWMEFKAPAGLNNSMIGLDIAGYDLRKQPGTAHAPDVLLGLAAREAWGMAMRGKARELSASLGFGALPKDPTARRHLTAHLLCLMGINDQHLRDVSMMLGPPLLEHHAMKILVALADKLPDVRWLLVGEVFQEFAPHRILGPVATWSLPVLEDGRPMTICRGAGQPPVMALTVRPRCRVNIHDTLRSLHDQSFAAVNVDDNLNETDSAGQPIVNSIIPGLLAMAMLHMKNIVTEVHNPPERLSRRHQKRTGQPLIRCKTLVIKPGREVQRRQEGEHASERQCALHLCRGNWAKYTKEKPLFGPGGYVGEVWRPPHAVGDPAVGIVVKDYLVEAPRKERGRAVPPKPVKGPMEQSTELRPAKATGLAVNGTAARDRRSGCQNRKTQRHSRK